MTSAQGGRPISDPNAYRGNLFTLLGERNPLHVIEQTASTLADVVRTHAPAVLRARPFADKWTPNEIIGHLVDGEWVSGYRLRLTLCEDAPTILGMNQDRWVRACSTTNATPRRSWTRFERCASSIWRCGGGCHRQSWNGAVVTTSAARSRSP